MPFFCFFPTGAAAVVAAAYVLLGGTTRDDAVESNAFREGEERTDMDKFEILCFVLSRLGLVYPPHGRDVTLTSVNAVM